MKRTKNLWVIQDKDDGNFLSQENGGYPTFSKLLHARTFSSREAARRHVRRSENVDIIKLTEVMNKPDDHTPRKKEKRTRQNA